MTTQKITITNLDLMASVGLYDAEKEQQQTIRLNLTATLTPHRPRADSFEDIVCYHQLSQTLSAYFKASGHIHTLEHAAYDMLDLCFAHHKRIQSVTLTLEKIGVIENCARVGISLTQSRKAE